MGAEASARPNLTARLWQFFQLIQCLPLEIVHKNEGQWSELLWWMAKTHRLSVYDKAYLYLAMDRGYALATWDKKLAGAGKLVGVPIFTA